MKQEPTKNNLVALGKLSPHSYFTPLLTRPLLTGVNMARFTHRPGFEIKIFQKNYFPQKIPLHLLFYPVIGYRLFKAVAPPCSAPFVVPMSG
jgi:hypothetical protein